MQQYEMVSGLFYLKIQSNFLIRLDTPNDGIVLLSLFQAVAYMGDDFMFQLFGKYRDMALAVKNPCHLNMAACLIKQKRFDEAIAQCSIVCSSLVLLHFMNFHSCTHHLHYMRATSLVPV